MQSALLDVRHIAPERILREQKPRPTSDDGEGWSAPDPAHRADWRRQRVAVEQSRAMHTPWGVRRVRRFSVIKSGCELVRYGLTATGLLPVVTRPSLTIARTEIELTYRHLPAAFEGYRVLQISDPHFDALDGLGEAIRARVADLPVDLCVFTGDYRAAEAGRFRQRSILEPMARIVAQVAAPDGSFAVLGNHDTHEMLEPLEQTGVRMLVNERAVIARGGQTVELVGFDDPYRFYTASSRQFAESLAQGPDAFRIMLIHTPDFAEQAADLNCALYLCGHTHGGQICLPGGLPIVQHLHKEKRLGYGLWRRRQMVGYTSRGAGVAGSLPIRLFAPSEVTLFTLRRATA